MRPLTDDEWTRLVNDLAGPAPAGALAYVDQLMAELREEEADDA